jgi:hypothetical protein
MGGEGGMGGNPPQLWEGQSRGVDVCFNIAGDGLTLECDQAQCQTVLDGYPQCVPEPEP